jgi:hypothetical protein
MVEFGVVQEEGEKVRNFLKDCDWDTIKGAFEAKLSSIIALKHY